MYAIGNSDPNPPVGAILADANGRIIGRGYTQPVGGAHAEINAIEDARRNFGIESVKGSTLYVTLEPCSHYGKTPPCTNAIIDYNIRKVIIGVPDQTEKVQGIEILKSKGIEVSLEDSRLFQDQLLWTLDAFHFVEKKARPRIFLKWAQSNNGFLAPFEGH